MSAAWCNWRVTPEAVDQPEPDEGENQIGDPDADRLEQGSLAFQTRQFKNAWSEIEHRIDTGELVEKRNEHGQQNRHPQTPGPEPRARHFIPAGLLDPAGLGEDFLIGGLRPHQPEHGRSRLQISFASDEPTRTFREFQAQQGIGESGDRFHSQHPAPRVFAANPGENGIG